MLLIAGCAHRPAGLPKAAALVAEQSGRMAFAASEDGLLFIYDADDKKMVYSTPGHINDKLLFVPERNQILLNGRVMLETPMNPNHVYHLYFAKG